MRGETGVSRVATRSTVLALGALVVLAAALRFPTLGLQSFWLDESTTGIIVSQPGPGDVLQFVWDVETTPPLFYLLEWAWAQVAGDGDVALRLLPALFGTLTVPVAFAMGRRAASERAGLVAAAFVAASPLLVYYSQESRPYALLAFLAATSVLCLQRALERPTPGRLATWAAVAVLAMATQYFAVFIVVPEALWLLRRHPGRASAAAVAGAGAGGALLLPLVLHQASDDRTGFIRTIALGDRIRDAGHYFLKGTVTAPGVGLGIAAALLALAGFALLALRTASREQRGAALPLVLGALAIVVPLMLAFAGGELDVFFYRNLIGAWVLLATALAVGFASSRAAPGGLIAAGALVVVWVAIAIGMQTDSLYHRADWEGLAQALGEPAEHRVIYLDPGFHDGPLRRYGRQLYPLHGSSPVTVHELASAGVFDPAFVAPETHPRQPAFKLVSSERLRALGVVRYRSARPQKVSAASLGVPGLVKGEPALYFEPAAPRP